jgi:hypothetical protein
VQSANDATAFVACDCNSTPNSAAQVEIRRRGWIDTALALHQDQPTSDQDIGATKPTVTTRIDYVFIRAHSLLKLASSRRFMNTSAASTALPSGRLWPSDHYGVTDTVTR